MTLHSIVYTASRTHGVFLANLVKISQSIGLIIDKQAGTCAILCFEVLSLFNPHSQALTREMVDERVL